MLLGGKFTLYGLTSGATLAFTYTTLSGEFVVGAPVTVAPSTGVTNVTLSAPYHNASMWGHLSVTGNVNEQLNDVWIQACPASEAFDVTCQGGISQAVSAFENGSVDTAAPSFTVGYAIDLPSGTWNVAPVGSTDADFATDAVLGPCTPWS